MCIGVSVSDCGIKPKLEKILEDYLSSAYINGITSNSNLCRPEIIVVSDPGQDLDDEMALILLRALIEEGLVNCSKAHALDSQQINVRFSHEGLSIVLAFSTCRWVLGLTWWVK